MKHPSYTFTVACTVLSGVLASSNAMAAEPSGEPRCIEIGSEKAVILRDSKSADGRNALAWTIDSTEPVDWPLLEKDADHFYEQYDVKEVWVVNLSDNKKVGTISDKGGYVRPGSHRTLSVAWGPVENGRRFALAAYQWKWGTDTLLLLDVGADDSRSAQIGPALDKAIEMQVKRGKSRRRGPYDSTYLLTGLPELGKKTGFSGPTTVGIPFVTRDREQDAKVSEGVLTLKLVRTGEGPAANVTRIAPGPLPDDPFSESARLAKADRELNAIYSALLRRLDRSAQEGLRTEQRAWVEQRDRQADEAVHNKSDAENPRIVRDRVLRELTEQRSTELRKQLEGKRSATNPN
jgi:lysozyme inhibitor LprI